LPADGRVGHIARTDGGELFGLAARMAYRRARSRIPSTRTCCPCCPDRSPALTPSLRVIEQALKVRLARDGDRAVAWVATADVQAT